MSQSMLARLITWQVIADGSEIPDTEFVDPMLTTSTESVMNKPSHIADQYLSIWNESDAATRRSLITAAFTGDASYVDPMMKSAGHDGIDAMIAAAQRQFAGFRFNVLGTPDGHNDVVRFSWSLAVPGDSPIACGTDVAVVASDGRLRSVTGFLDTVPAAA
jgi:hypothetical protein